MEIDYCSPYIGQHFDGGPRQGHGDLESWGHCTILTQHPIIYEFERLILTPRMLLVRQIGGSWDILLPQRERALKRECQALKRIHRTFFNRIELFRGRILPQNA